MVPQGIASIIGTASYNPMPAAFSFALASTYADGSAVANHAVPRQIQPMHPGVMQRALAVPDNTTASHAASNSKQYPSSPDRTDARKLRASSSGRADSDESAGPDMARFLEDVDLGNSTPSSDEAQPQKSMSSP